MPADRRTILDPERAVDELAREHEVLADMQAADSERVERLAREVGSAMQGARAAQPQPEHWHLDKKVPIGIIFAIVLQGLGAVLYVARMEARLDQRLALIEADNRQLHESDQDAERQRAADSSSLVSRLDRLEVKLDRLIEARLPR